MGASAKQISRRVRVINDLGLHARSAARIAALAQNSQGRIRIKKGDQEANARSIVDLLTLACEKGTQITVRIENPQDVDVLDAIVKLVETGFGE